MMGNLSDLMLKDHHRAARVSRSVGVCVGVGV